MDKVDYEVISGDDFGEITVVVIDSEKWVLGTDTARVLGHVWAEYAVKKYVKACDRRNADIPDTQTVINRNGLHALAVKSPKKDVVTVENAIIKAVWQQEEQQTEPVEDVPNETETAETYNNDDTGKTAENGIITVNRHELTVKEYNGQRVVTFKDIDACHERADGTARKRFNDNKKHFIEGEDYFKVKCSEVRPFFGQTLPNGYNPHTDIVLITESGYLMLVKSFTDDLAWIVQRELVNSYFKLKSVEKEVKSQADESMEKRGLEIREQEMKIRKAESCIRLAEMITDEDSRNMIAIHTFNELSGMNIPFPFTSERNVGFSGDNTESDTDEKLYSPKETALIFGMSHQKFVCFAKQYNIYGNEEYGKFIHYYNVDIFFYNEKAVSRFAEIINNTSQQIPGIIS